MRGLICVLLVVAGLFACGCSQSTTAAPESQIKASGLTAVTFDVPAMMCEQGCGPVIKETLVAQPGVTGVEISMKKAVVNVDAAQFDADKAIAALAAAGYPGSSVQQ